MNTSFILEPTLSSVKSKKFSKKKEEESGGGILIGPLDSIPEGNGNGPQEKETKDLHQGNIAQSKYDAQVDNKSNGVLKSIYLGREQVFLYCYC